MVLSLDARHSLSSKAIATSSKEVNEDGSRSERAIDGFLGTSGAGPPPVAASCSVMPWRLANRPAAANAADRSPLKGLSAASFSRL